MRPTTVPDRRGPPARRRHRLVAELAEQSRRPGARPSEQPDEASRRSAARAPRPATSRGGRAGRAGRPGRASRVISMPSRVMPRAAKSGQVAAEPPARRGEDAQDEDRGGQQVGGVAGDEGEGARHPHEIRAAEGGDRRRSSVGCGVGVEDAARGAEELRHGEQPHREGDQHVAPEERASAASSREDRRHDEEQRHVEEVGLEAQHADQQVGQLGIEDLEQPQDGARRPARRRAAGGRRLVARAARGCGGSRRRPRGAGRPWRNRRGPGRRAGATCGCAPSKMSEDHGDLNGQPPAAGRTRRPPRQPRASSRMRMIMPRASRPAPPRTPRGRRATIAPAASGGRGAAGAPPRERRRSGRDRRRAAASTRRGRAASPLRKVSAAGADGLLEAAAPRADTRQPQAIPSRATMPKGSS